MLYNTSNTNLCSSTNLYIEIMQIIKLHLLDITGASHATICRQAGKLNSLNFKMQKLHDPSNNFSLISHYTSNITFDFRII